MAATRSQPASRLGREGSSHVLRWRLSREPSYLGNPVRTLRLVEGWWYKGLARESSSVSTSGKPWGTPAERDGES